MKNVFIVLALTLALFVAACTPANTANNASNNSSPETAPSEPGAPSTPTGETTQTPSETEPNEPTGVVKEIAMDVNEFAFTPNALAVEEGATLRITLTNSGEKTHGFAVPELNINQEIEPGETKVITINADEAGEYRFLCSVPCGSGHRSMTGTITVS